MMKIDNSLAYLIATIIVFIVTFVFFKISEHCSTFETDISAKFVALTSPILFPAYYIVADALLNRFK